MNATQSRPRSGARGRTPLFRKVSRLLEQARVLERRPELGGFLTEWKQASREGPGPASRRDFLRRAAAFGLALPFSGVLGSGLRTPARQEAPASNGRGAIAIVGAGVAGLTAAYRLQKAGVACEVFEGSTRTGGRIYTRADFNKEGMFCELGAELVDSNHTDLITLCGELNLGIQELKTGETGTDIYFFGGKHYTDHDLLPKFGPLAAELLKDQEGLEVEDESGEIDWSDKARKFDQMSLREYLASKKGTVDAWILDMIDVAYTGEYGLDTSLQSSLNLLSYISADTTEGFKIFGDSDESKRVKGGNSMLPDALTKSLEGKTPIRRGHRLVKIEDDGKKTTLTFNAGGKTVTHSFPVVVMAMPFTLLREVEGIQALELTPEKKESIAKLGYGTNCKVMYGFTERWWRNPKSGAPASNGSVYTDLPSQCFWETSRAQDGKSGILTNFLGGKAGTVEFTPDRFQKALDDLNRVFPGIKERHDGNKASWMWPTYAFSKGSYSCPMVGQVTTIFSAAAEPELGKRLHFAGEHTSADFAGFMNGAVESGNRVAAAILD